MVGVHFFNGLLGDWTVSAFKEQVGGNHYTKMAIQPAEYCFKNGIGKLEGDAIAYLSRWKDKNGLEDLKKARHTIDLLIELEVSKRNETVNAINGNDLKVSICDTMNLADSFLKDIRATELAYAENQHKTLWTEADEERAGIIALNGNEGDHYREAMNWKQIGEEIIQGMRARGVLAARRQALRHEVQA